MVSFKRIAAATAALGLALGMVSSANAADLFNDTNTGGVGNNPYNAATFTVSGTARINQIVTYHWNYGSGSRPGTISLRAQNGAMIGPFQARGTSGQGGAANVNWVADVSLSLAPGTYTIVDSDPGTWSHNPQSNGRGFAIVSGDIVSPAYASSYAVGPGPMRPTFNPAPIAPTPRPTPVAAPAPAPSSCTMNGGVARISPCQGRAGTMLTITLLKPIQRPITLVSFKPYNVSLAGATGANILSKVNGSGTAAGSVYTLPAPIQLCITRGGSWDLFPVDYYGTNLGDIGQFTTVGCP